MLVGTTLSVDHYFLMLQAEQPLTAVHEGSHDTPMAVPSAYPARGPDQLHLKCSHSCDPACLPGPAVVALTHVVPITKGDPPSRVTVEIPTNCHGKWGAIALLLGP